MIRERFVGPTLAAMLAAIVLAPQQANAGDRKPVVVIPPVQLQIERDRAQARQFQLRQQIDRAQDRRMNLQPQPTPNVPVMRSTCTPTNGVSCN